VIRRHLLVITLFLASGSTPAAAQVSQPEHAARRDSLLARVGDGIVLVLGAPEPVHDYLSFFQAPDFLYLTGVVEPDAALVMVRRGAERTSWMFVQPRDPAAEVWSGRRIGVDGITRLTGMRGRGVGDLGVVVDSLLGAGLPLLVVGDYSDRPEPIRTRDEQLVGELIAKKPRATVRVGNGLVAGLRRTKSAAELDLLRKSIDITADAHREAMRSIEPGMNEFEVQALIEYTFRRNGADRPGFATIVGSGPNSTTLHYNADDRFMNAGEVVVMDIGASYRGYSADVTRTVPVTGVFSPEQRAIYEIVRAAQRAAEEAAKPGVSLAGLNMTASRVLAEGLARLGLIEGVDATFECSTGMRCRQLGLFYMHGLGHDIGLEVHDPQSSTLAIGTAFTIEPGIYVRSNLLEVIPDTPANRGLRARLGPLVARYGDIGVRIEDDYFVTTDGVEWVSRAPREIDEVEMLMREPYSGPAARDVVKVNWYRGRGGR
jgi:Xaa-Pro aminopeptidase